MICYSYLSAKRFDMEVNMIKSRKMKSIIFCLVTTLMLSMALTACGNKKESSEKQGRTHLHKT